MVAKVIEEGFVSPGFNAEGNFRKMELAMVHAKVPGENGEWMYVVQDNQFCWIKGLPEGEGYMIYRLPLEGHNTVWNRQIEAYVSAGVPESKEGELVATGSKSPLAGEKVFLVAE